MGVAGHGGVGSSAAPAHDNQAGHSIDEGELHEDNHGDFFLQRVTSALHARDRQDFERILRKGLAFGWAIISCLCAGSIATYAIYAPFFQTRLKYSQVRINTISIVAEVALYSFVPLLGFVCDKYGPRPLSLAASLLYAAGYFIAARIYGDGFHDDTEHDNQSFGIMVVAFIFVGIGTCAMYLAAVTTCAKNFGRGKYRGFALAAPIASFGLSGMWLSQVGSRLFVEHEAEGLQVLDVRKYFFFLAGLLLGVGLVGTVLLQVVDEQEMIEEAVEEMERSGLLPQEDRFIARSYGTLNDGGARRDDEVDEDLKADLEGKRKKAWLLRSETKLFLTDRTMWWLAAGFFLVTGPGEAFINNLGTVLETFRDPKASDFDSTDHTSPATHVSIVAISSTIARLAAGALSDILGPTTASRQPNGSMAASMISSRRPSLSSVYGKPFSISRVTLLLASTIILSVGFLLVATGWVQNHADDRFWLISALVGTGYGATFSLVPIIISTVWGVENFGTNWGIVAVVPAFGAAIWGSVYAYVYDTGIDQADRLSGRAGEGKCFGPQCYRTTFWAETIVVWVAVILWYWAWQGPDGWRRRGVVV